MNNVLERYNKIDKLISFSLAFQFTVLGIKNVLIGSNPFLFSINEILNIYILSIVVILYFISTILSFRRTLHSGFIFLFFFVLFSFIFTYLVFPQNVPFIEQYILRVIIVCFWSCYLISKLHLTEYFFKYMRFGSYLITVSLILYSAEVYVIGHTTVNEFQTYSMSMSNVALLSIMFQLHSFFKEHNKLALLSSFVACCILIMYGSRNQLLAIMVYVVLQMWSTKSLVNVNVRLLGLLFIPILALFMTQIVSNTAGLLESFGIQSRTLSLLDTSAENFTSNRNTIHEQLWIYIWDNSILGLGISGDESNIEELAHSLYLSIWCTYGLLVGTAFMIAVFFLMKHSLKKSYGLSHQLLVIYMCMVFPRGFTGGDMWTSDVFWLLLGISFMILNNKYKYECKCFA